MARQEIKNMTKNQLQHAVYNRIDNFSGANLKVTKYGGAYNVTAPIRIMADGSVHKIKARVIPLAGNKFIIKTPASTFAKSGHYQITTGSTDKLGEKIAIAMETQMKGLYKYDCRKFLKVAKKLGQPIGKKQKECIKYYQDLDSIDDLVHSIKKANQKHDRQAIISFSNIIMLVITCGTDKEYEHLIKEIASARLLENFNGSVFAFVFGTMAIGQAVRLMTGEIKRVAKLGAHGKFSPVFVNGLAASYRGNPAVQVTVNHLDSLTINGAELIEVMKKASNDYLLSWFIINQILTYLLNDPQKTLDQVTDLIAK